MRKVLIIGQIWPYHVRAGGPCVHALGKYLPEHGWEPIVLTTPLPGKVEPGYRVVEVPYYDALKTWMKRLGFDAGESVQKQLSQRLNITARKSFLDFVFLRLREVLTFPDGYKGWQSPATREASKIIESEGVSAIITDNPPVTAQLVARALKQKHRVPWVVYFSHLWSQNNGYPYSRPRRMLDQRLEQKTFSLADAMVTHSEPLAEKQRSLHKGKLVISTYEGFDPAMTNDPPARLTEKFTITYTGSFAVGLREPTMLFQALRNLLSRGAIDRSKVEVRFYGPEELWIDSDIKKYGLSDVVRQYGRVPQHVAIQAQRESQILFNPKWDDPQEPGIYSGKIFEYLAARRPILATGKYGDVVDGLLRETAAGVSVLSVESTERAVEAMYRQYAEEGRVVFSGDIPKIEKMSHRGLAGTLADALARFT